MIKWNNINKLAQNMVAARMTMQVQRHNSSAEMLPQRSDDVSHFKTLAVTTPKPFVFHVELHRPNKLNAINKQMWLEIKDCFERLGTNPDCRAIVISAAGKHFTAGIDLSDMMKLGQELADVEDVARKGVVLDRLIKLYQDSLSALEHCPKPVITAVHQACIGAGVDLITASDIRLCTQDAFFQVKEVDIGMAADVGTLQRLPKAIGSQSLARELCYTGRRFEAAEAEHCGLVSRVFPDKESLLSGALALAENIAGKSPIAVQTTKINMVYSLEHTNQEGLDHIRTINKLHLQSEDFAQAVAAQLTKDEKPVYAKL
ncbi:delta(3,5)-Delta(2,4)-dienoyl-CoA isomerase, mitochondrial [Scaptodrosophila lebanonensis]|uniref:Delta(3,5)-Delta(2,4)-dienoyl-CoA isomerase, mitochondrial n=1 Tax=Drosophila lebanonensis TaxID=7225 RepID=A0A6J2TT53_DROLE|nr:delta(3,5)-Delta(2,4)-dienoyl-CoA isomerase, mitochondrial [Scaptodrosophila lebanonensis]